MPNPCPALTEQQFAAALQTAGLTLRPAELASVLQTARWLHDGATQVASYLATDDKTGGGHAPR